MTYFNGFALQGEEHYFKQYMEEGDYVISGFSYGAIKAFQEASARTTRVDKLQLFSPAFFQNRSEKFKRLQFIGYQKDSGAYLAKFTQNCFDPHRAEVLSYAAHDLSQLEELLSYEWNMEALQALRSAGTQIEVYLGGQDKISDVEAAYEFFRSVATVTLIKGANHFLQGDIDE